MPLCLVVQLIPLLLLLIHCMVNNIFSGSSNPCHHGQYYFSLKLHSQKNTISAHILQCAVAKLRACYLHS